jgi:ABC-type amino acid transport substrate-binding protein
MSLRERGYLTKNAVRLTAVFLTAFSVTAASAQTQVPSNSRLKAVASTKTIKVAYRADARPFSFVNDKKEPVGYSLDLCRLVVKSMQTQLGIPEIKIEWVPVTVQTRFSAVASGKADLECGSSTVTLGRMKEVEFHLCRKHRHHCREGRQCRQISRNGRQENSRCVRYDERKSHR